MMEHAQLAHAARSTNDTTDQEDTDNRAIVDSLDTDDGGATEFEVESAEIQVVATAASTAQTIAGQDIEIGREEESVTIVTPYFTEAEVDMLESDDKAADSTDASPDDGDAGNPAAKDTEPGAA